MMSDQSHLNSLLSFLSDVEVSSNYCLLASDEKTAEYNKHERSENWDYSPEISVIMDKLEKIKSEHHQRNIQYLELNESYLRRKTNCENSLVTVDIDNQEKIRKLDEEYRKVIKEHELLATEVEAACCDIENKRCLLEKECRDEAKSRVDKCSNYEASCTEALRKKIQKWKKSDKLRYLDLSTNETGEIKKEVTASLEKELNSTIEYQNKSLEELRHQLESDFKQFKLTVRRKMDHDLNVRKLTCDEEIKAALNQIDEDFRHTHQQMIDENRRDLQGEVALLKTRLEEELQAIKNAEAEMKEIHIQEIVKSLALFEQEINAIQIKNQEALDMNNSKFQFTINDMNQLRQAETAQRIMTRMKDLQRQVDSELDLIAKKLMAEYNAFKNELENKNSDTIQRLEDRNIKEIQTLCEHDRKVRSECETIKNGIEEIKQKIVDALERRDSLRKELDAAKESVLKEEGYLVNFIQSKEAQLLGDERKWNDALQHARNEVTDVSLIASETEYSILSYQESCCDEIKSLTDKNREDISTVQQKIQKTMNIKHEHLRVKELELQSIKQQFMVFEKELDDARRIYLSSE